MNKNKLKVRIGQFLSLTVMLVAGAFAVSAYSQNSEIETGLRHRAEKVYNFDRQHLNMLPSNQLTSLSLAIEFKNYHGAEKVLDKLESMMGSSAPLSALSVKFNHYAN